MRYLFDLKNGQSAVISKINGNKGFIHMNLRMVIALNMYDELTARGDRFDYEQLGKMIDIPIISTVASKGNGKADTPFVMELPPYRIPTLRNISIHTWAKSVQYLTKMGTVILVASILVWVLGYFPQNNTVLAEDATEEMMIAHSSEQMENSYIGRMGQTIEPIIAPLGYDWKIGVSILTGVAAKEIVISSMGVLYQTDLEADETSVGLQEKLQEQIFTSGPRAGEKVFTPLVAYSFMLFILIYFPCIAALAAIRREAGICWAIFTAFYTTALA